MGILTLDDGTTISYTAQRSRKAQRIRLTVTTECTLRITLPPLIPEAAGVAFAQRRCRWIAHQVQKTKALTVFRYDTWNEYYRLAGAARSLVEHYISIHAPRLGVEVADVRIRNTKSRWGSCNGSGVVMCNYRIVYLPERVAEYLVVHELCHLLHANHSCTFWRSVKSCLPDCRERDRALKHYVIR